MSALNLFMLVFKILGGLAIFLLGMNILSEGLRNAVGSKLQPLLAKTTKNRISGLGLGTTLGTAIHSGPTIVMLLGFVNAGLMTLEQTLAPMMGANIGTTLAMQAVSFKITDYCYHAISVGLILSLVLSSPKGKGIGRSILGFGLLFLGMTTMSSSISNYKDFFSYYLQGSDGNTFSGIMIGVLLSTILTSIWQSSGATIAIVFALITAGVFTELHQVFPIILGAQIGKCVTALMGSLGTNIEARRTALAPLLFNVLSVILAIIARPLFYDVIPMTSSDLLRQTANLNTAVMLFSALLLLPFTEYLAKFVRFLLPSQRPIPESTHLNYLLIEYPEQAMVAVISELQRVSKVCANSLYLTAHVILHSYDRSTVMHIKMNEKVVNDIKLALREYLWSMTKKYLSRRQIILSNHLIRCTNDIERIGDHIDQLCDLSINRPLNVLDKETFDALFHLYEKAIFILDLVIQSLNPKLQSFQESAMTILNARDQYIESSIEIKEKYMSNVETHEVSSIAAIYFNEYVSVLDRMIRHIESIALAQNHDDFWIKKTKLNKKPKELGESNVSSIDPSDYLSKLHTSDYL